MTVLNRHIGIILVISLVSWGLVCAETQPAQTAKQTDTWLSTPQNPESNQAKVLSWGGHESIKECVTCHSPVTDTDPAPKKPVMNAAMPHLCTTCHTAMSDLKGWVHGPVATGQCVICHDPHQSSTQSLLKKPIPELCRQCHEPASLQQVRNHQDPAFAQCQVCHEAHAGPRRMLLKPEYVKAQELLALMTSQPPAATKSVGDHESLQGIDGVQILAVVDRAKRFERYGLTQRKLHDLVEQSLQMLGIPVRNQDTHTERTASLYVHLSLVEVPSPQSGQIVALSGSLNLRLRQTVELPALPGDDTHRLCTATTWDTGSIVVWGTRQYNQGLKETLGVFMTQFAQAYKKVN